MKPPSFRQVLADQPFTFGAWIQVGHPAVAEIFGQAGFDWVCVDLEHGAIGLESMTNLFRALAPHPACPVARLPANDPVWIRRSLDAGAQGIIIPSVNSPEEARAAVREAKYPPMGARGFGYARSNGHGVRFQSAIASANEEVALIVQIEHVDALERVEDILAVDGVDAALIGPMDLSGSMGICGQVDHPDMRAGQRRFIESCRRAGKPAGLHLVHPDPDSVRARIDDGFTLLVLGIDGVFLAESSAKTLDTARDAVAVHAAHREGSPV